MKAGLKIEVADKLESGRATGAFAHYWSFRIYL